MHAAVCLSVILMGMPQAFVLHASVLRLRWWCVLSPACCYGRVLCCQTWQTVVWQVSFQDW